MSRLLYGTKTQVMRRNGCILLLTLFIASCTSEGVPIHKQEDDALLHPTEVSLNEQEVKISSVNNNNNNNNNREFTKIEQCAKELQALKTTNPQNFDKLQSRFDQMIATVNRYSQVRSSLKSQTQDTVEALYTYKVSRICNDIEQYLLDGLTNDILLKNEGGHK